MSTSENCTRELLLQSLRDHDAAAKKNMQIATQHLKRGYQIARELEKIALPAAEIERGAAI
jgi:hypothetical protein